MSHLGAVALAAALTSSIVAVSAARADEYTGATPAFDGQQHVYFIPNIFAAGFVAEHGGLGMLSAQFFSGETHYPFYIVIFQSVGGPVRDPDSTRDAVWETVKAWQSAAGFDAQRATVIALSVNERSLASKPGAQWQSGLGLEGDTLANIEREAFVPLAKDGQLVAGLRALVVALDGRFTSGVAHAQAPLRSALAEADQLLAAAPKGVDLAALAAAITHARAVLGTDDLARLRAAAERIATVLQDARELDTAHTELRRLIETGDRFVANGPSTLFADLVPAYRTARERASSLDASTDRQALRDAATVLSAAVSALDARVTRWQRAEVNLHDFQTVAQRLLAMDEPDFFAALRGEDLTPLRAALEAAEQLRPYDIAGYERVAGELLRELNRLQELVTSYRALRTRLETAVQNMEQQLADHSELLASAAERVEQLEKLIAEGRAALSLAYSDDRTRVNVSSNRATMERVLADLARELGALEKLISELQMEASLRAVAIGVVFFAAIGLALSVIFYGVNRRRRYLRVRGKLERDLERLSEQIGSALVQMQALIETRDRTQVTALGRLEGRTKQEFEKISAGIIEIFGGLEALEARVAECRALLHGATFGGRLPAAERAAALLGAPLEFRREAVHATRGLFDAPATEAVEAIDPAEFTKGLAKQYAAAQESWRIIEQAIDAATRNPRDDFPITGFDGLRAKLAEAAIPDHWLAQHPLQQSDRVWSELDLLKTRDPVGYLEHLGAYQAQHRHFAQKIDDLIADAQAGRAAKAAADHIVIDYTQTVVQGADDPREAETSALAAFAQLERLLSTADAAYDERAVDIEAIAVKEAYAEVVKRKTRLVDVMRNVADDLLQADAKRIAAHDDAKLARQESAALATEHAPRAIEAVAVQLAAVAQDLRDADHAQVEGVRMLAAHNHFSADAQVQRMKSECAEITAGLVRAREMMTTLRAAKQEALATVERARAWIAELERAQAERSATVTDMTTQHAGQGMASADREVRNAARDIAEAKTALERAEQCVATREFATALLAANDALRECEEATDNQSDVSEQVEALLSAQAEFVQRHAALDGIRGAHARQILQYQLEAVTYLNIGDELREVIVQSNGPSDWVTLVAQIHAVEKAWNAGEAEARKDYLAEQARQAEIRAEAKRQKLAAAERRRRAQEAADAAAAARLISSLVGGGGSRGGSGGISFGGGRGGGGGGGSRGGAGGVSW